MGKLEMLLSVESRIADLKNELVEMEQVATILRGHKGAPVVPEGTQTKGGGGKTRQAREAKAATHRHHGYVKIAQALITKNNGVPMHTDEIFEAIQRKLGKSVTKASVVGSIFQASKAKHPKLDKTGKSTFGVHAEPATAVQAPAN